MVKHLLFLQKFAVIRSFQNPPLRFITMKSRGNLCYLLFFPLSWLRLSLKKSLWIVFRMSTRLTSFPSFASLFFPNRRFFSHFIFFSLSSSFSLFSFPFHGFLRLSSFSYIFVHFLFSRGHATLHPTLSVGRLIGQLVGLLVGWSV